MEAVLVGIRARFCLFALSPRFVCAGRSQRSCGHFLVSPRQHLIRTSARRRTEKRARYEHTRKPHLRGFALRLHLLTAHIPAYNTLRAYHCLPVSPSI